MQNLLQNHVILSSIVTFGQETLSNMLFLLLLLYHAKPPFPEKMKVLVSSIRHSNMCHVRHSGPEFE